MNTTIQNIKLSAKRCGCLTAATVGLSLALAPSIFASVVNLGAAAGYAVVGVGGSFSIQSQSDFGIYQSATVINGNVAEGPYTTLTHGIDATVNGRWDYDATDTPHPPGPVTGTVTGGFMQKNMSIVSSDAIAASTAAATLPFTASRSTLSDGDVINLSAGLNVIQILNSVTIKTTLTINGAANSSVVFQLVSSGQGVDLTLSGMTMVLSGGITAGDIVWDLDGYSSQKNDVTITSGSTVYGIFLAPQRNVIVDHGNITGEVIGGGLNNDPGLNIHSGSTVTGLIAPVAPVPEPTTFIAGALLLLPFGASTLRILLRKATA